VADVGTSAAPGRTVSVIDTATGWVTATVPVGIGPNRVVVAPDGRHAYVTDYGTDTTPDTAVSVIDTATNAVTATIPVGKGPRGIAVTPDGGHAYVADGSDTVSVIDTGSG
jgi:YVTN family beta-propeller protein